jgi:competence protein ComEA
VSRIERLRAAITPQGLRRLDQAGIAVLTLVAVITLAGYWLAHGAHRGELIEIDRAEPQPAQFIVDINQADWPELSQLPGIGETLARRIVDSRLEQGPFADHEDLRRVRGIGPLTLDRLRPYLRPMPPDENVAGR